MAAYRFSAQIIGRSSGRSATGAAAYRAAAMITDERTGLVHDYTRKGGVLHTEILAPADTPAWMLDRARLWNGVEAAEKRKDAQLSREILLNLPHELTAEQRRDLVLAFVRDAFVSRGMVADVAIHAPHRQGDDRNHHAHILLTLRSLTGDGFGPKARDWNSADLLDHWRADWADRQNRALEQAGSAERVDHRSLEARGIDREPEPKQGPVATERERNGQNSKAGDDRRAAKARNAERDELHRQAQVIDLELERLRRQDQAAGQQSPSPIPPKPSAEDRKAARRERQRFDAWANGRRAALQSARHDAETQLGRTHQAEWLALDAQQAGARAYSQLHYGEALAAIEQRQAWRGLGRFLYRVSGQAGRDQANAAALRATIQDLEQRQAEQRQALTTRQKAGRSGLAGWQGRKADQVEKGISQARARREAEGWTARQKTGPEPARDAQPENLPVETGPVVEGDRPAPEPSEAVHAQTSGAGEAEPTPAGLKPWTAEERASHVAAEAARREAREAAQRGNELDPGREMDR